MFRYLIGLLLGITLSFSATTNIVIVPTTTEVSNIVLSIIAGSTFQGNPKVTSLLSITNGAPTLLFANPDITNYNVMGMVLSYDGAFRFYRASNSVVDTNYMLVISNNGKFYFRDGLTVTNDVLVAGSTTNRMVWVGGILVSNITNYFP